MHRKEANQSKDEERQDLKTKSPSMRGRPHEHHRNLKLCVRVFVDLICFTVTGVGMLLIEQFGSPTISGFYCPDAHLTHPVKPAALGDSSALCVGALAPFLTIFLTELVWIIVKDVNHKSTTWLFNVYLHAMNYCFSLLVVLFITEILKYSFGSLSPTFFAICNPNVDCTKVENQFKYIDNYTCLGTDKIKIKQARLSFPSEHASMVSHGMSYLVFYIERKFRWHGSFMVKKLLQGGLISLGVFLSSFQVLDNSHHVSDVLGGALLGSAFGCATCFTTKDKSHS